MLRALLLADTHLDFDFPWKPRGQRRRRGPDFFANYERVQPALDGDVDLVVHGGDVLFGSKVPPRLVQMAFEPLMGRRRRRAGGGGARQPRALGDPYPLLDSHPAVQILCTVDRAPRGQEAAPRGGGLSVRAPRRPGAVRRAARPHRLEHEAADIGLLCLH